MTTQKCPDPTMPWYIDGSCIERCDPSGGLYTVDANKLDECNCASATGDITHYYKPPVYDDGIGGTGSLISAGVCTEIPECTAGTTWKEALLTCKYE